MKHLHDILRLGLVAAGLCVTGQAGAQTLAALPDPSLEARIVGQARPVLAWTKLCERLPAECEVDTTEPAAIAAPVYSRSFSPCTSPTVRENGD